MITLLTLLLWSNLSPTLPYKVVVPLQDNPVHIPLQIMGKDTSITLNELRGEKGLVVVFYRRNCPYNKHYSERLKTIQEKYFNKGFNFCVITHGTTPPSFLTNTIALIDDTKTVTHLLGAKKSTEVYVFSTLYDNLKVVYHGAIDDNPYDADDVNEHFLDVSLSNILYRKRQSNISTMAYGCYLE